jgi:predicted DNA-binding antitoxin AbrB/MazE fold protein
MTVTAIYQGGVLRPAEPLPLADGTTVEVDVRPPAGQDTLAQAMAEATATLDAVAAGGQRPPLTAPDPEEAYRLMKAIMELPEVPNGDPTVTGRDHDRVLYGPRGAR